MKKSGKKIIIAMSGGVDSSVAAALLKEQGHELVGIFMHFWAENLPNTEQVNNKCCSVESFNDARRVANQLNFPLYTLNLDDIFKSKIVDTFINDYAQGRTPNPCVTCNKHIKFDAIIQKADELGFDAVATGHYAKKVEKDNHFLLERPKDLNKDQTYFLHTLTEDKLRRIIFPLADLTKPEVRELAHKYGLTVAKKPESQEICFVAGKSHNDFLKRHLKLTPGPIITNEGTKVGEHAGLPLYTIGQRKGVEIGGIGPFYVNGFDFDKNVLYVTNNGDDISLFKDNLNARDVTWINSDEPIFPLECKAVIRYRHLPEEVVINKNENFYTVHFKKAQRAITSGQSVVFYNNNTVLGGGTIS